MSILTLQMPARQVVMNVADNTLVYDGQNFVAPEDAKYVMLYDIPVDALSLPFQYPAVHFQTNAANKCAVLAYNGTTEPSTSPEVIHVGDPSMGLCICGITCQGVNLAYVKVTNEEP